MSGERPVPGSRCGKKPTTEGLWRLRLSGDNSWFDSPRPGRNYWHKGRSTNRMALSVTWPPVLIQSYVNASAVTFGVGTKPHLSDLPNKSVLALQRSLTYTSTGSLAILTLPLL